MAGKRTKKESLPTPIPSQKDIARIFIDTTDVAVNNTKNLILNTLRPLEVLEEQQLIKLMGELEKIGAQTKDAGINQLLSLYK